MKSPPPPTPAALAAGYEISDTRAGPVLLAGLLVAVLTAAAAGLAAVYLEVASRPDPAPSLGEPGHFTHGPYYRSSIARGWAMIEAEAAPHEGYAWVDRNRGIVRIPIEQAMRRIADTGEEAAP